MSLRVLTLVRQKRLMTTSLWRLLLRILITIQTPRLLILHLIQVLRSAVQIILLEYPQVKDRLLLFRQNKKCIEQQTSPVKIFILVLKNIKRNNEKPSRAYYKDAQLLITVKRLQIQEVTLDAAGKKRANFTNAGDCGCSGKCDC